MAGIGGEINPEIGIEHEVVHGQNEDWQFPKCSLDYHVGSTYVGNAPRVGAIG